MNNDTIKEVIDGLNVDDKIDLNGWGYIFTVDSVTENYVTAILNEQFFVNIRRQPTTRCSLSQIPKGSYVCDTNVSREIRLEQIKSIKTVRKDSDSCFDKRGERVTMSEVEEVRDTKRIYGMSCICGSSCISEGIVNVNGAQAYQMACSDCGIIMRAPVLTNDDGSNKAWLREHWANIHMLGKRRNIKYERWEPCCEGAYHVCSACKQEAPCNGIEEEVLTRFCPHCGKPMRVKRLEPTYVVI